MVSGSRRGKLGVQGNKEREKRSSWRFALSSFNVAKSASILC